MSEGDGISVVGEFICWLKMFEPLTFEFVEETRSLNVFCWTGEDDDQHSALAHYERIKPHAFEMNPPLGEFQGKIADQDLAWNVLFLKRLLQDWFANCHPVPPHWANRICVLLRKAKRFDLEREFLAAFIPHYATPYTSAENTPLIARAVKIGAL